MLSQFQILRFFDRYALRPEKIGSIQPSYPHFATQLTLCCNKLSWRSLKENRKKKQTRKHFQIYIAEISRKITRKDGIENLTASGAEG